MMSWNILWDIYIFTVIYIIYSENFRKWPATKGPMLGNFTPLHNIFIFICHAFEFWLALNVYSFADDTLCRPDPPPTIVPIKNLAKLFTPRALSQNFTVCLITWESKFESLSIGLAASNSFFDNLCPIKFFNIDFHILFWIGLLFYFSAFYLFP